MITIELDRRNDISLVAIIYPHTLKVSQYVVCNDYDATMPYGQQWHGGRYAECLGVANMLFDNATREICETRKDEILTKALNFLEEMNLIDDFEYDTDDYLSDVERSYYGLREL